jgi:hypothetical protein
MMKAKSQGFSQNKIDFFKKIFTRDDTDKVSYQRNKYIFLWIET